MSNITNLRDTITPKSDQLNADDLIGTSRTVKVTAVKRGGHDDPIVIHYEGDDGRPYKPCKSMRRVLIFAWGENGENWIGQSMTLYTDPSVKFGGKEVGGIRISHMSGIKGKININLTATRGQKKLYTIEPLKPVERQPYPVDKFDKAFPTMKEWIQSGKMTTEQVINKCEATGTLSDEQRQKIRECALDANEEDMDDEPQIVE